MKLAQQQQALLDLVQADRERRCAQLQGQAQQQAQALRAQALADARQRVRQAFADERERTRSSLAAAQARLATQRRLHEQQRTSALLQQAWQQLPEELLLLWQDPATRQAWVRHVLAAAAAQLPAGGWRLIHAPGLTPPELEALALQLPAWGSAPGAAQPAFETDDSLAAGIKVIAAGNVIDGTLQGLLAERSEIESQLLRQLEGDAAPAAAPQAGS